LGKEPDRVLAQELGCSLNTVWQQRKNRGIPSFRKHQRWRWESVVNRLGKEADCILAEELGCSPGHIFRQRQKRGIPRFKGHHRRRRPFFDWKRVADRLGKVPDVILAKELGCSRAAVRQQRTRRGIRCFRPLASHFDFAKYHSLFGKQSDRSIAKLIECSHEMATEYRKTQKISGLDSRWIDWAKWDSKLGTISDHELAKQIGCCDQAVLRRRHALGIPSTRRANL
jgi:hypothetical protein